MAAFVSIIMKMSVLLCYLLNIKGKRFEETRRIRAEKALDDNFINDYLQQFPLDDELIKLYLSESGTFLTRYKNSIKHFKSNFSPEFFTGKTVLEIGSGRGPNVLYLSKEANAAFVFGVEIEQNAVDFSEKMLIDHKIHNAKILCRDMAYVPEIDDNSIDIIISIAAFEHIHNLKDILDESYRILRKGGILYSSFSPIWRHYYGSHLSKYIPFPWTHLLFSEPTVRKTIECLQKKPQNGILYSGLNKYSLKDYIEIINSSKFRVTQFEMGTDSRIKKHALKIPILNEFYSGSINIALEK